MIEGAERARQVIMEDKVKNLINVWHISPRLLAGEANIDDRKVYTVIVEYAANVSARKEEQE